MPNDIAHFAIHADDCQRAKAFYENVFDWTFEPWGPPNFWRIHTSPGAIHGALQQRRTPVTGAGMIGFECSISVANIEAIAASIKTHGGKVTTPPFQIDGVGTLVMFEDTEGNIVGAMQYWNPLNDAAHSQLTPSWAHHHLHHTRPTPLALPAT